MHVAALLPGPKPAESAEHFARFAHSAGGAKRSLRSSRSPLDAWQPHWAQALARMMTKRLRRDATSATC
eukprot:13641170-Alexandrium_andersonii.AAC.1